MKMNNSIRAELKAHILSYINDDVLTDDNVEDWHHHAFNGSYYIVGHYNASEWLKAHGVDAFDAVDTVRGYEMDNFGEVYTKVNSESIVNMYVYILGEELLGDIGAYSIEEIKKAVA